MAALEEQLAKLTAELKQNKKENAEQVGALLRITHHMPNPFQS